MELFSSWLSRLEQIKNTAQVELSALNSSQLNWKSADKKWSIAQCLDHLIVSNEKYFALLDKLATGTYSMTFWEKYNPLSGYTGRKMAESLGPKGIKPFVSPKIFEPGRSTIRTTIVNDFIQHQEKFISKILLLRDLNTDLLVVTSPVAPLITYKLKDCIEILVGHEERHLLQAKRVMQLAEFPGI